MMMRTMPKRIELASLAQTKCTLSDFSYLVHSMIPKDNLYKNIVLHNNLVRNIPILIVSVLKQDFWPKNSIMQYM